MLAGCPDNRAPTIESLVGPIISALQFFRCQAGWPIDDMTRVVEVPVLCDNPILGGHLSKHRRSGIWGEDVKCSRSDSALNGPIDSARKDVRVFAIQSKDETAIDHDAKAVQPPHHFTIITAK